MSNAFSSQWLLPVALFLWMNFCAAIFAWRAALALLPDGALSERILAAGTVYFATAITLSIIASNHGMGLVWPCGVATALLLVGMFLLPVLESKEDFSCENGNFESTGNIAGEPATRDPFPIAVKILIAATGAAVLFMFLWSVATPPPPGGDGYIYHLYFPAAWLQAGHIVYVPLPYGAQAASYYPLNTELYFLWLILPLHEDFMTNSAQLFALLLAAAGVYSLARRLGAGRPGAATGACAAILLPGFVQQAGVARVDIFFSLWMLGAISFLYSWLKTGAKAHFFLFGLSWGLFLGTKSLAVPYSACIFLLFVAALAWRRMKLPGFDATLLTFAVFLVFGGMWYARNWMFTGNPLYPLEFTLGGKVIFAGAYGKEAMRVFHKSDPRELLRIADLFLGRGPGVMLLACGVIVGVGWFKGFFRHRFTQIGTDLEKKKQEIEKKKNQNKSKKQRQDSEQNDAELYILFLPLLVLALFWWVNPHNNLTNGRFLFPAFLFACVYPALAVGRGRGLWQKIVAGLVPVALLAGALQPGSDHLRHMIPDIASAMAGNGTPLLSPARAALWVLAAAGILSAIASTKSTNKLGTGPGFSGKKLSGKSAALIRLRSVSVGLWVAAIICLFAGMCLTWQYYRDYKYQWVRATAGVAGQAWYMFDRQTPQPLVVANVGNERAYPLFGTGLRHKVVMVNVDGHPSRQFHDYESAARLAGEPLETNSERPQYHRRHADPNAWMSNLRSEGVQLLFCSNLEPIAMSFMQHTPDGFPIEVDWMRERPQHFRKVFSLKDDQRSISSPGDDSTAVRGDTYAVEVYAFTP